MKQRCSKVNWQMNSTQSLESFETRFSKVIFSLNVYLIINWQMNSTQGSESFEVHFSKTFVSTNRAFTVNWQMIQLKVHKSKPKVIIEIFILESAFSDI